MPQRHKCLFLASDFPPPLVGGALVYYHYLLSSCREVDLVVVTRRKEKSADFDAQMPCAVHRTRSLPGHGASRLKGLLCYVWLLPMLLIWISRYRVPVLHLASLKTIVPGWLASRISGCSLVVSVFGEDLTALGKQSGLVRRIQYRATVAALRRTERMLTIATFGKEALLKIGIPEERIEIITPGIDVAKTPDEIHIDPGIASRLAGKRILLTVGRLVARKGQDMVIRALPELVAQYPALHYVIAAGGLNAETGRESCEKLASELGVRGHVSVFANLDNASVAWLYQACEIFIMANRTMPNGDTEGYGIVFLEAGAWGKPVIGGRAGGVVDAVDDGSTGILVEGTRADDIAQAIEKLLSDGALAKRMGAAGREKVLRNGWDSKAGQYGRMIDRLAGGGADRSARPPAGPGQSAR